MDKRALPSATTRPLPPQRALTGSSVPFAKPQTRPSLPSRLSTVHSASQPSFSGDLIGHGSQAAQSNSTAYFGNHGAICTSPGVIDPNDDDDDDDDDACIEPPAKRARIAAPGSREERKADDEADGSAYRLAPGEQLPTPPKRTMVDCRSSLSKERRHQGECAARKANGVEPPAIATKLPPPKTVADFSVWLGNHPEDTLNDTVVKAGYCDKGSGANESNSAKPAIWQNLTSKNNTGLQMLSYLFTQVLDKRQLRGKCSVPSTFRPPPRVTVTDSKREAWLRDLANPDILLRKQSRTIPHGIRGKGLLDQCLMKEIPLQRAVWLAKCVGANELRAFRRKGVSGAAAAAGESKWVLEWTVSVEQYLESVVALCGQQFWFDKWSYSVRLAVALYGEGLLDQTHYLDWIVSGFSHASLPTLPVWLSLVQQHWKDIVAYVRRGRKLVVAILEYLRSIKQDSVSGFAPLKIRLEKLLATLAVTNRGWLVIPKFWRKYRSLLQPTSPTNSTSSLGYRLAVRNERLAAPLACTEADARSSLLQLYDLLDGAVTEPTDSQLLADRCLAKLNRPYDLIIALLEWATSPYRTGHARVYLCAMLIKNFRVRGFDTDAIILAHLQSNAGYTKGSMGNLFRIIGELVRMEAFAAGRYLQWLISSGLLSRHDLAHPAVGLLAALPESALSAYAVSTRRALLSRFTSGAKAHEEFLVRMRRFNATLNSGASSDAILSEVDDISVKMAVADQLRRTLAHWPDQFSLARSQFRTIREVLEIAEDISALPELIYTASVTDETATLAIITDTITMHSDSFTALGLLGSLTDHIAERYRILRAQQPLDRSLILALSRLARVHQHNSSLIELLDHDVVLCDQQVSAVVCSPASDNFIGMHATKLDSDEDIDAVFASGNNMDDQLLRRVFDRVMQRVSAKAFDQKPSKVSSWLNQLRLVGGVSFQELAIGFIRAGLQSVDALALRLPALVALVASECADLNNIIQSASQIGSSEAAYVAVRMLLPLGSRVDFLTCDENYKVQAMQRLFSVQHTEIATQLMLAASAYPLFDPKEPAVIDLLLCLCTQASRAVLSFATANHDGMLSEASKTLWLTALGVERDSDAPLVSAIELADALSVNISIGAITSLSRPCSCSNDASEVQEALKRAVLNDSDVWPQLVDATDNALKRVLHIWAREQLLNQSSPAQQYQVLLNLTYTAVENVDNCAVMATLAEKLKTIHAQFSNYAISTIDEEDTTRQSEIYTLLHVCALQAYVSIMDHEKSHRAKCNLLLSLLALLVHPAVPSKSDLAEYLFDVASVLADSLPEDTIRSIGTSIKSTEPRIRAIVGASDTTQHTRLALASQAQPPGSAQQRALARHTSQQPSTSAQPAATSLSSVAPPQPSQSRPWPFVAPSRPATEIKMCAFSLRKWEIMPDATPVMGENDTSLSMSLFGARKA